MATVRPVAISGFDQNSSSKLFAWVAIVGIGAFIFWGTMRPAKRKAA
jgi:hypothetical protein